MYPEAFHAGIMSGGASQKDYLLHISPNASSTKSTFEFPHYLNDCSALEVEMKIGSDNTYTRWFGDHYTYGLCLFNNSTPFICGTIYLRSHLGWIYVPEGYHTFRFEFGNAFYMDGEFIKSIGVFASINKYHMCIGGTYSEVCRSESWYKRVSFEENGEIVANYKPANEGGVVVMKDVVSGTYVGQRSGNIDTLELIEIQ